MERFTASEVRRAAECPYVLSRNNDMLRAYADLLEAQEKAVSVAWMVGNSMDGPFAFRKTLPTGWAVITPLYTHPTPADAERLAEALRKLTLQWRSANPHGTDKSMTVGAKIAYTWCAEQIEEILSAHSAQAQPPAARVPDWTDAQCVAFMATGLRHTEYKKGKSPTVEEIRQGARAALAAQENING